MYLQMNNIKLHDIELINDLFYLFRVVTKRGIREHMPHAK